MGYPYRTMGMFGGALFYYQIVPGNQTWLAGKSPNYSFILFPVKPCKTSIFVGGISQPAMFDDTIAGKHAVQSFPATQVIDDAKKEQAAGIPEIRTISVIWLESTNQ